MTNTPPVPIAPNTRTKRRRSRRFTVLAGILLAAILVTVWARRGESFEEQALHAEQETDRELRTLATASGLEVRDLISRRATLPECGWHQDGCGADRPEGTVRFELGRPGGATGGDQARLVLKGLTDNGYTLVAQRCDFQAYGGVFANAAGDSLRVAVGFNGDGAVFEAKIGFDHERLTVDEFPFIDSIRRN